MNKTKKKFSCPYCAKEFLRGSRGYGNHFRSAHPAEYSRGLKLYGSSLASATWDKIDLAAEAAYRSSISRRRSSDGIEVEYKGGSWQQKDLQEIMPGLVTDLLDNLVEAVKSETADQLEIALAWFPANPLLFNAVLSLTAQDLEKAKFYLEREIERRKGGKEVPATNVS